MKRREFLQYTIPAVSIPLLLGGMSLTAFGRSRMLNNIGAVAANDRVLVLIQLNGGNDGLNTVIPLDQYAALTVARSNILIDAAKVLKLTAATGLHPSMTGLQTMYTAGKLAVVQGVSYPSPNLSHFRATDIWLTGSDSNKYLSTGWAGRYLNEEFASYPTGYPNTTMPDPLAIQIGSVVSPGFQGPAVSMGMAITDPNSTYLLPGGSDTPPNTPAGHELTFVRQIAQQTQAYSSGIKAAAAKGKNKSVLYPSAGQNLLADQLKIVAQLIAGGLKTKIYMVNLGGFDTHSAQVSTSGSTDTGTHATLLGKLSAAIFAFQDDLTLLGIDDRVVGMTFSEFGRRIKSNASFGTDHGTAAPVFLFGSNANGGILGSNPSIPSNAGTGDNLSMQFDYRSLYVTLLKNWFGASPSMLANAITSYASTPVPAVSLIKPSAALDVSGQSLAPVSTVLEQNYPNPFNPATQIQFSLASSGYVVLSVCNVNGREVARLVDRHLEAGQHSIQWNAAGLPSGAYFYTLQAGSFRQVRKLMLMK
ncbi:MAG: DUF1501 domain-containing protein [Ignavibacteriales bacterium]|nr:DUF1501 domain-containing protein [Ignavibacteriales bacterium]